MPFRVWKLGGSLFDLPDLAQRLRLLHRFTSGEGPVVIIAGGGLFADAVRHLESIHRLDTHTSHELALQAMRMSSRFVAKLLGQHPVESSDLQDKRRVYWTEEQASDLEVWDVIGTWQENFSRLSSEFGEIPCNWSLSSDSIAAILAAFWGAERLVLLKSVDVLPASVPQDWAVDGHVDSAFPRFAGHMTQLEWVNLRSASFGIGAQKERLE